MKSKTIFLTCLSMLLFASSAGAANPRVLLETTHGDIVVELYPDKAPAAVENFLGYVEGGFYDGTIFHRIIQDFMIQGGGFTPDYRKKPTGPPIQNEANNGLANERGTIAMARTGDPHSATSQFFINTVDNRNLDFRTTSAGGWGYCVFARVVDGMTVVDRIAATPTTTVKSRFQNAPKEPVVIEKASVVTTDTDTDESPVSSDATQEPVL